MALTKVSRGLLSTGIVDNSNATAITIGSDESVTLTSTVTTTGLTVNTDENSSLSISDGGTNAITMNAAAGDELYMGANNTYAIRILGDGTNDVVLDNGSNLGIGVSPKDWKTDWHVLNIGPEAAFYSQETATAGISENIYYSSSNNWTAVTTGPSSIYQLDSGSHNFYTLASVSAGATASPVQRMAIENDGSVTVPGTLHSPGHVIQTVYAENSTVVVPSQTQNDFTTLVQVNITPKDATSKILINGMAAVNLNGGNYPAIHARIYRGSTQVKSMLYWGYEGSQTHHRILNQPVHFLDSPATTSALTYYVKIANASGSTYTGTYTARGNSYNTSTISVQEIAQ